MRIGQAVVLSVSALSFIACGSEEPAAPVAFSLDFVKGVDSGQVRNGRYECYASLRVIASGDTGAGAAFQPLSYTIRLSDGRSLTTPMSAAETVEFLGSDKVFSDQELFTGVWTFWWDDITQLRFTLTLHFSWSGLGGAASGTRQIAFTC